jgi:asparagine synthase (glutamine-hydrolysing)
MCGIYGGACLTGGPLPKADQLSEMARLLRHRGPDANTSWTDGSVALGCQRLRIVDLSRAADQPFSSPDGRYHVVCNGEIYNHLELRQRFAEYPYRSNSDVETIVPLLLSQGIEGLAELEGMFAVAVWDAHERALTLARDRAGEKPLFIARSGPCLWFASELQALLPVTEDHQIDPEAVHEYLARGFVCQPRTFFRGIHKCAAGSITTFTEGATRELPFWPEEPLSEASALALPPGSNSVDELERLLEHAMHTQLQGDQPIGLFLSGGLDSSLLAAMLTKQYGSNRLTSFAAKFGREFSDGDFDEENWAGAVAERFGFEHRAVVVDEGALEQAFEAVCRGIAEPVADPAILPTYLLAQRAREEVPVVLGGEGADELFGGYPTYLGHRFARAYMKTPGLVRRPFEAAVRRLPASHRKVSIEFLLKRFLASASLPWDERHRQWLGPAMGRLLEPSFRNSGTKPEFEPPLVEERIRRAIDAPKQEFVRAMRLDYFTYLRENLLVKLDRACMLHSVESRAPYLDVAVTRFAWSLPANQLIRGTRTKQLLKKVAERKLPKRFVHRRKRGLSVPIADWINGGLRPEVDRLLGTEALRRQGMFDATALNDLLAAHRSGAVDASRALWPVVVLQRWLENWCPSLSV